jgi:hypothetical protein
MGEETWTEKSDNTVRFLNLINIRSKGHGIFMFLLIDDDQHCS